MVEIENKRGVRTGIVEMDSYPGVPEWVFWELKAYVLEGQDTGSFLQAVIANDLKDSIGRGDDPSVLQPLVRLLYNDCPGSCWGSRELYTRWIKIGTVVQWLLFQIDNAPKVGGPVLGCWPHIGAKDGEGTFVALIDAPDMESAVAEVKDGWDEPTIITCEEYPADWRPNSTTYPMP